MPLEYFVFGYPNNSKNEFLFDNGLNWKLLDLIRKYSGGRPTLVFCSSRKGCVTAANQVG